MSNRDHIRIQIDTLPDIVIDKVYEFISFQLHSLKKTNIDAIEPIDETTGSWAEFDQIVADSVDKNNLLDDIAFTRCAIDRELINFGEA
jgi:hypothetical protein